MTGARLARRWVGRHWLFGVALSAGAGLRLVAVLGFRPALWFNDGFEYVGVALRLHPYRIRPDGYSWFLRLLRPLHSFTLVVAGQHLIGLGIATLCYALLRRWTVPAWLATGATLPQLLDARQVQLEHLMMSDTLFAGLLAGAVTLLAWRSRPAWPAAAGSGLLLSAAALTRSIGLPLLALAGCYLLLRRPGWRPVLAFAALAAAPLAGYAAWFHAWHGEYALTSSDGVFLYARTMSFADCTKIRPPADLGVLCDRRPVSVRPPPSDYIWHPSGLDRLPGQPPAPLLPADRFVPARNDPARSFALRAIRAQPLDYARVVVADLRRGFRWDVEPFPTPAVVRAYRFAARPAVQLGRFRLVAGGTAAGDTAAYQGSSAATTVVQPYAGWLIGYQRVAQLRGPLLAGILAAGPVGLLASRRRDDRRWPVGLLWTVSVGLLVIPPMTAQFDYRYTSAAVPFGCAAAALAARVSRLGGRGGSAGGSPARR